MSDGSCHEATQAAIADRDSTREASSSSTLTDHFVTAIDKSYHGRNPFGGVRRSESRSAAPERHCRDHTALTSLTISSCFAHVNRSIRPRPAHASNVPPTPFDSAPFTAQVRQNALGPAVAAKAPEAEARRAPNPKVAACDQDSQALRPESVSWCESSVRSRALERGPHRSASL